MQVTVEFIGWINRYISLDSRITITLSTGSTIRCALKQLNIPIELAQNILLNGKQADLDNHLKGGDLLQFLPLICGG